MTYTRSYRISGSSEHFIAFLVVVAFIFFAPLIGVILGAFSGWVVSLFFDVTIRTTLKAFGADLANVETWQIGATLGFVGGFFKSSLSTKSSGN
jgi:uncharacterized membrane protein